jgi:DNA-binding response OmpR family regulator
MLEAAGYGVIAAHSFMEGRAALGLSPAAVVTALQLGEFNGLHLVVAGRAADPGLVGVVLDTTYDAGREVDTLGAEAAYIVEPVRPGTVLALLSTLLARGKPPEMEPMLLGLSQERRQFDRRMIVMPHVPERRRHQRRF